MISTKKNVANVVGGKTARACDSCIKKRARWYCAADDAFLCEACDSLVHSANQLAGRHERVRLKTASFKSIHELHVEKPKSAPSWHHGFTRKARTPRHGKHSSIHQTPKLQQESATRNPFHLVPEVGSDEALSNEENEEQLLYRVPIYDPFVAELCNTPTSANSADHTVAVTGANDVEITSTKSRVSLANCNNGVDTLHGFLPSEMDLAEFAADVESLLGRGLENGCMGMKELGLIDSKEKEEEGSRECRVTSGKVKVEDEEGSGEAFIGCQVEAMDQMVMEREAFELTFDHEYSPTTCEEEEEEEKVALDVKSGGDDVTKKKKMKLLSLDYDAIITAWASQGCPWTTGDRPDECWLDSMGAYGADFQNPYGELGGIACHQAIADAGGREARVSRYREKRRTRLFSKKIRYEVRKLNAEKRPRMKGRFVKRASFAAPAFP
ncbi:zinc finger protein CONSTANS-LIKE 16-like [Quillaja saponaria]|uniref:Zinc finger protein CONSTANS-LIKE 16-like n=1 Tax=Quillaja saponaria TaxID=32244 RepID=A0AAD7L9T7_QUISA|nr:zinc finger protein CONSTANS-LIKE 16-like [Quillaja saponaria]